MYLGPNPPTYRQAQRYRVNRSGALGELGAAFGSGGSKRPGLFGARRSSPGPTETANRYEGSACPPGQTVVNRETRQHAPKFAGGPTRTDYVYCRPGTSAGPAAAPAAARTEVSPTITVSPTFQQAFTPQVSPVFQQTQDSPGATQAATPVQSAPGGQEATGGGSGGDPSGLLEFMREMEAARAQEREERRRQEAAAEADRRAREEAARQEAAAAAAEAEAARQAELEELQRQMRQPQQTIYQPGAAPRAPTGVPAPATAQPVEEGGGVPLIAIVGAGAAIALLAFMGSKPKRKR